MSDDVQVARRGFALTITGLAHFLEEHGMEPGDVTTVVGNGLADVLAGRLGGSQPAAEQLRALADMLESDPNSGIALGGLS